MSGPTRHLNDAAEHVRAFNTISHTTGTGWQDPADTYDAISALTELVDRLGQAIQQATQPAVQAYEDGRLTVVGDNNPDDAISSLRNWLADAQQHTTGLLRALNGMHNTTSPMGRREDT